MVSLSFLLKSLNRFPFCNETIFIFNFFQWIYLYVVCNTKFYDCLIHKSLLDIKQGVFFVIKHNFLNPLFVSYGVIAVNP